jgi:hypothetical protein
MAEEEIYLFSALTRWNHTEGAGSRRPRPQSPPRRHFKTVPGGVDYELVLHRSSVARRMSFRVARNFDAGPGRVNSPIYRGFPLV